MIRTQPCAESRATNNRARVRAVLLVMSLPTFAPATASGQQFRGTLVGTVTEGIPPSGERPTSWQTFLRAHCGALRAADFFTTEGWTFRGLVTYYTVFVIELQSRRVRIVGSTIHPDEAFMIQIARHLTDGTDGALQEGWVLICDRDRKWSSGVRHLLQMSGVRVVQTPYRAPNCNAHAERFVRSIKAADGEWLYALCTAPRNGLGCHPAQTARQCALAADDGPGG